MFGNLTQGLLDLAYNIINIFPADPVSTYFVVDSAVEDFMGYLNFFIPVGTISDITAAWLLCVAVYYVYQVILRWVKVIE